MPRKPTLPARQAREALIKLATESDPETALPTVRELGTRFELHAATVFRLLRDLAMEGVVWQSPAGRFFPAGAQKRNLQGAPICFIGREMWQWSRLYQEILEGVSEVCSANGSPLILLSSPSLVKQATPTEPPRFATPQIQQKDLSTLLRAVPRGCGGFILDHLWDRAATVLPIFPGGERVQVLHGSGQPARVVAPDYADGARQVHEYCLERGFREAALVVPFAGDPAIEAAMDALRERFAGWPLREIAPRDAAALPPSATLICPEDNTAQALLDALPGRAPSLIATQGTGGVHAPLARLRYDYRRLGRSAAARIFHGREDKPLRPAFIAGGGRLD